MKTKWYLGTTKGLHPQAVYLRDFEWACGWYWSGGYIGNDNFHAHFDGAFLETPDIRGHCLGNFVTPWTNLSENEKKNAMILKNGCAVWEDLSTFLDNPQYDAQEWWRIKDLFKQFYTLKAAAEVFQYGGHCTSHGRNKKEINNAMAKKINAHIRDVVIVEIRKALNKSVDKV